MGDVPRTEHSALSATALERRDFPMLAGFALFQAWVTLCFFTPQLFPDAVGDNNVYMLSLAVSVAEMCIRDSSSTAASWPSNSAWSP